MWRQSSAQRTATLLLLLLLLMAMFPGPAAAVVEPSAGRPAPGQSSGASCALQHVTAPLLLLQPPPCLWQH
jgi:hypothetical protein